VMHGLLRVRGFTQYDAHIFCTPDQIEDEIVNCLEFAIDVLKTFGFEQYEAELSTWDGGKGGKYEGAAELWERAENALKRAAERLNLKVTLIPDEAAFYGPKIDMKLLDALGRKWQLSTVQFDWNLPGKFDLEYVAEDGKKHQPVMVHRALYGSVERFFGILLEHYAGAFPLWLAPVQAVVMPITDRQLAYAQRVHAALEEAGLRSHLDDRKEKVNLKIRDAQMQKVPYMLVVGDREAEAGSVSVRHRKHGDQGAKPLDQFIADVAALVDSKSVVE
jgi:threonyl-tRNA synthetase